MFAMVKRVKLRNRAKFCQNRSNRCRDMVIFAIFQDGGRRHLDFKNFKFLTIRMVKKVELHQYAEFHRNRSNCSQDM